jgi:alpha-galactosidase
MRSLETGDDLYPLFWERLESSDPEYEPLCRVLGQVYGLYPAVGDTHAGEYIADAWRYVGTEGYDFARYARNAEELRQKVRNVGSGDTEEAQAWLSRTSGERAIPVIAALKGDRNSYEEAVNIVNGGAIANLPEDALVEVPAIVSALGVQAIQVPPLPTGIAALCRRQVAIQELVLEAAMTGSRDAALQALVLDPVVPDTETARAVLEDLLAVHAGGIALG